MVHGNDEDEEDLDETEVLFALQDYAEDRQEPTPEALAYADKWRASEAAAEAVRLAGSEAAGGVAPTSTSRGTSPLPTGRPASRHRLWQSVEARERFRLCLRHAHSSAAVSLAAKSLRVHCAAFGTLGWRPPRGKGDEDADLAMSAWVHADAFTGEDGKRHKKK
jgi:hypothetical protein